MPLGRAPNAESGESGPETRDNARADAEEKSREANGHGADILDETLIRLSTRSPVFAGGLANHAPMVAEALVTLGRADAVLPWVDTYAPRLEAWPRSAGRIDADAWPSALGKSARVTDWREFFNEQLANASFHDVLANPIPSFISRPRTGSAPTCPSEGAGSAGLPTQAFGHRAVP